MKDEFVIESSTIIPDNRTTIRFRRSNIYNQIEAVAVVLRKGQPNRVILVLNPKGLNVALKKTKAIRITEEEEGGLGKVLSKIMVDVLGK